MRMLLIVLAFAGSAGMNVSGETRSADSVRQIELRFAAPCCRHENLAVHNSAAAEMRAEIAALVARGDPEERIVYRFAARYGEQIPAEPRGRLFRILSAAPVLFSLTAEVREAVCSALSDFDFE